MNDDQRIKKMEDLIQKKKAAGEKIEFGTGSNSLTESSVEQSLTEEAAEDEEEELEDELQDY